MINTVKKEVPPQSQFMNEDVHTNGGENTLSPDVEENSSTESDSEMMILTTEKDSYVPSITDIVCDFNGSVAFVVGSSGFILSMYFDNWLPYFRYGSMAWIWGCFFYSIPLMLKLFNKEGSERDSYPWNIGDWSLFLCCLFYIIGCVFGSLDSEDAIEKHLDLINYMFVFGSFSLVIEPIHQVYLLSTASGSFRSRLSKSKLLGDGSLAVTVAVKEINSENDVVTPLKLNWDRCFELLATTFFCGAGVFGGFPPHPSYALPGVYFWEVGSVFALFRSILMLQKRRQVQFHL